MKPRARKLARAGKIVNHILDLGLKSVPLYLGHGQDRGIKSLHTILSQFDAKQRYSYKRALRQLEHEGYVNLGEEVILLTDKGKQFLRDHQIFQPLEQQTKWGGTWQIISYDIPNEFNKQRNHFRAILKQWGFYRLHKSTWVYPHPCKQEIAALADELRIAPFVLYLQTDELPIEKKLMTLFNLSL